jgi:SAM-dependent methyltransferase
MTDADIAAANARLANGGLRHRDGTPVQREILGGFVSADGRFAYAQHDGITMLLASSAILMQAADAADERSERWLSDEKGAVRAFYDDVGWTTGDDGTFVDTDLFIDTRPIVRDYNSVCRQRVQRHLAPGGRYLLDVASGPVQFPEYQAYSQAFDTRICVDLSCAALAGARSNLGRHGTYIVGDITNLPFVDDALDGVVSLHTIYHVPADEQATAFREIHRVLRPGCSAVVAYSWQTIPWRERSLPMRIALLPVRLVGRARKAVEAVRRRSPAAAGEDELRLYYHAHHRVWFERQDWPFDPEIAVWSTVSPEWLRTYIHPRLLGAQILELVRRLEDRWPPVAGRIGRYPLIVIRKT